ncbi:hypothetical protein BSL78_03292 [Apostichopus japonicus]|uniref:Integrase catalytic domain-containing protein n=1 Tax=Stichopus japonicus TaxID=307972 RepID=A0A2G8LHV3_STIJA|nr:hypothetical protein BSL78_03292 [Apostichopus japonicus]
MVVVPKADKSVRICGDYKGIQWDWTSKCEEAFEACKVFLTSEKLLVHYDPNQKLKLACDASSYGLGAVLSHEFENGDEKPICYASRTMSPSEKNYSQIEREALSLIFGVKKFHDFLYGRKFILVTDHKPLLAILGPKSGVPTIAAARMQRWALVLSAYDYEIEYRDSASHANCDALSRLPSKDTSNEGMEGQVFAVNVIDDNFPVLAEDLSKATKVDPVLSKVHQLVFTGWPENSDQLSEAFKPYFQRRDQLSCEQGCVLWGTRVVVPKQFHEQVLNELHWEHPGICSMKALARSFVWWPKLDADIEQRRVHVDFCEDKKHYFLILIDAHSKWVEVKPMSKTTVNRTIDELRMIFARHGLPEQLVSDNGPQFTSHEFGEFMRKDGIKHVLVAPYHPASNGAAERAVRLFKESFTKQVIEGNKERSLNHKIADFL